MNAVAFYVQGVSASTDWCSPALCAWICQEDMIKKYDLQCNARRSQKKIVRTEIREDRRDVNWRGTAGGPLSVLSALHPLLVHLAASALGIQSGQGVSSYQLVACPLCCLTLDVSISVLTGRALCLSHQLAAGAFVVMLPAAKSTAASLDKVV